MPSTTTRSSLLQCPQPETSITTIGRPDWQMLERDLLRNRQESAPAHAVLEALVRRRRRTKEHRWCRHRHRPSRRSAFAKIWWRWRSTRHPRSSFPRSLSSSTYSTGGITYKSQIQVSGSRMKSSPPRRPPPNYHQTKPSVRFLSWLGFPNPSLYIFIHSWIHWRRLGQMMTAAFFNKIFFIQLSGHVKIFLVRTTRNSPHLP